MLCQSSVWNHPPTRPANVLFPAHGEEEESEQYVGAKSGDALEGHVSDTTLGSCQGDVAAEGRVQSYRGPILFRASTAFPLSVAAFPVGLSR